MRPKNRQNKAREPYYRQNDPDEPKYGTFFLYRGSNRYGEPLGAQKIEEERSHRGTHSVRNQNPIQPRGYDPAEDDVVVFEVECNVNTHKSDEEDENVQRVRRVVSRCIHCGLFERDGVEFTDLVACSSSNEKWGYHCFKYPKKTELSPPESYK